MIPDIPRIDKPAGHTYTHWLEIFMRDPREIMRKILTEATPAAIRAASAAMSIPVEYIEARINEADPTENKRHTGYILNQWKSENIQLPRDEWAVKRLLKWFDSQMTGSPIKYGSLLDIEDASKMFLFPSAENQFEGLDKEENIALHHPREPDYLIYKVESNEAWAAHGPLGIPRSGVSFGMGIPDPFDDVWILYEYAPKSDGANPRFPYRKILWWTGQYQTGLFVDPRKIVRDATASNIGMQDKAKAMFSGGSRVLDAVAFMELGDKAASIKEMMQPRRHWKNKHARANYEDWLRTVAPLHPAALKALESPNVRVEDNTGADNRAGIFSDMHSVHKYTEGNDPVSAANRRVLDRWKEEHPARELSVWDDSAGIEVGSHNEELWALWERLDNYPVLDEDELAPVELDQADEAWESWAADEFKRSLEKAFNIDDYIETNESVYDAFDDLANDDLRELFERYAEWIPESGGMYVNVKRVVEKVTKEDIEELIGMPLE
jgi:hypothetical protein